MPPPGIAAVQWSNAPNLPGSDDPVAHAIQSRDNVYFTLENPAAYAAMLQAGLTQLEFAVTTNCGNVGTHTVPVTLLADPGAQVGLVNAPTDLRWTQGESRFLEIAVSDPGHDVLSIGGYLFPQGWQPPAQENLYISDEPAVTAITTHGLVLSHHVLADMQNSPDDDPVNWRLWLNAVDDFVFRLPVPELFNIPPGSHDLRLLTIEADGRIALSDPVPTTVVGNTTPPVLSAATVDYRVPAGESIPVWFEAHKIGTLARVTLSAGGSVSGGIFEDERDAAGKRSFSGQFMVPIADTAQSGDIVHILVTAEDALGMTATFEITFEVGSWGAETVVIDSPTTATESMRYSNAVVKSGGIFNYNDPAIKLNALTVESGGEVVIGSDAAELKLRAQLQVDAGGLLRAETVSSNNQGGWNAYGGAHGGDSSPNPGPHSNSIEAYDDFRKPQFPGGSAGRAAAVSGGGVLKLTVPAIIVNGVIAADGQGLTIEQTSPYGSGAGGSILIETDTISGSGTIRANGGDVANDNQGAGAGGRIAIYYENYGDGIIPIADGLDLQAHAGSASKVENGGGAGTVFLKKSDQQYGELHLDAAGLGHAQGKSTLRSIGRHMITDITPVEGESDLYRVEIGVETWRLPNPYFWRLGLRGLFVSFDADDFQAPLYEVMDNDNDDDDEVDYLIVRSNTAPEVVAGRELIGVIRLDKLVASAGVRLVAADRIHADRFDMAESATLAEVVEVYTDEVIDLGDLSIMDDDLYYAQNLHLDSLTMAGGSLASRGQITVAGNVSVSGQRSRLGARALNISGSLSVDNAVLETAVTHGIEIQGDATLTNNATLTVPAADENKYYRLDLAVNQTMRLENSAVDVSGKGYPRGRTWDNDSYPKDPTGGSHGGVGGKDHSTAPLAGYGDYLHPVHPGSGGNIDLDDSGRWGSPGGGAVRIQAAVLELADGSILANGGSGDGETHEGLIIRSVAGTGIAGYDGDGGSATQAMLNGPAGVDVDNAGNIYIADRDNHCIRKVAPDGTITTVAGNGSRGYNGDNIPATSAQLSRPTDVAVDGAGNIYIADSSNQRIRKVDPNGTITTVVGRGYSGYNGDYRTAASATLNYPYGITVDDAGRLYIADTSNSRIRKVDLQGTITTVAGTGSRGYNGDDRTATSAWLHSPYDVAVDGAGNIYIADFFNQRIRKVYPSGMIETITGTGSYGYHGDNGPAVSALLYYPTGVAVDGADNIYIADRTNHRIRKVDPSGTIMTIAGSGNPGDSGVHGAASGAQLYSPERVAVGSDGDIVIADTSNHRVRKVAPGDFNTISPTGAGGSILIEAGSIADTGTSSRIAANGGGLWQQEKYYTGSGGRVVLQYNDYLGLNPDRVTAHGGPSSSTEGYRGSAGTVYIQRGYGPGNLKVSNSDRIESRVIASDQTTSLEVVGQHRIAAVTDLGEENWLLQIDAALAPDRSYTGYFIDADASDTEGPYFEIVDIQGENGLIVASTDNLADIVGNDLVGVHKFTNLEIEGSASVDFGSDRIFFADTGDLQVDAAATLVAGSIINLAQFPTIDFRLDINDDLMADDLVIAKGDISVNGRLTAGNLEMAGGNLTVNDSLAVDDLVVTDGSLRVIGRLEAAHDLSVSSVDQSAVVEAGAIEVGADAMFAGTTVIAPTIVVHGSLVLTDATSFTIPEADESAVYPLDIQVDGDMTIEAGSSVDVSAKGYAAGRTWDNAPYYAYITGGSHGGIGGVYAGDEPLEPYGDYLHATYPGSGGNFFDSYGAPGGGAVRIRALSLSLNEGFIRANGGLVESDTHPTGAGGSIDIDVNTIDLSDDTSRIEANGADSWDPDNCWYYTGAGGRVVIRYAANPGPDLDGVSAYAGFSDCSNISGSAGTVYMQEGDQPGRLIVSNFNAAAGQSVSSDQPTPVEVVGRHRIISVANPQAHHWVIEIDGLLKAHREYAGYLIDVDAADTDGPYYEIIGTEGPSHLVVTATADLSQIAGNDLVGVHQFSQIKIASGATVDFGADRLIAPQSYGLDVGAGSALLVGGLIGGEQTVWSQSFHLTINGDYSISTLTVSDWYLTVTGRLTTTGDFYVRGVDEDAVVSSREIVVGGNAVISNATVITSDIHVQGDLTLLGDAAVTTFDADETSVYPLNIQVNNELIIYSGSVVDVSGKGYAQGRTWNNETYSAYQTGGSHAGIGGWNRSYELLDVYGDYLHAQYPGSGGRSGASNGVPGGGAVRIRAAVLELDDAAILANGSMLNSAGHPSGAGGSIDIEVGEIRDTGANYRIEANGGGSWNTSRYFTGGGRVVLRYGRDVGFDLTRVFAHGGNSGSSTDKKGSAGTVYLAPIGRPGTLKVSNADPLSGRTVASDLPTPMEVVGRQRIAGVEDRGNGRWAIDIWTAMEDVFETGCLDFESEVAYHSFEILEEAAINLQLDVFNVGGPGYMFDDLRIFRDDGDLTEDDFVDLSDIEFRGPPYFGATGSITLAAGSYILAIGPGPLDPDNAVNDTHQDCDQNSPPWIGSYELSMNTIPIIGPDKNPVGYLVDLDGSDLDGPYYEIVDVENPNRLIVAANEDLSAFADKDLVGIHLLEGLQIGGGAAADFGADRVIVLENDGLQVEPDSGLQVGGLQVGGLSNWQDMAWPSGFTLALNSDQTVNDLTIQDWNLTIQGRLEVANDLSITGVDAEAALEADMIVVDGGAQIVNSMVTASDIDVQGDLTLLDGATITVSEGNASTDYLLDIRVGSGIYVSNGSSIDVSGKGYPRGATWHDEPYAAQRTGGSHAGIGGWDYSYDLLDAYGDYRHARSVGSGGNYDASYGAPGGGAVRLDALSLELDDGHILANGGMGTSYYDATGAGGSVAIDVDIFNVLDNNSRIAANGGGAWNKRRYHTGAGGRVVLRYAEQLGLDPERISAHGGPSSYSGDKMGSAGTVYIEQAGQPGLLKISNFDPVYGQVIASAQPTPLEVVGKRHIESVSNLGDNQWLIRVAESFEPHRIYAGYLIDPDAADVDGPYYEILEMRDTNELLVYAEEDLSSFVDRDLVGVHELSRLQIEGGALVNFGWDRPLVPGGDAIVVGSDITELEAGSFFGWENADWPPGFNLLLNGNSAAYEWLATNMNWNLTVNGDLDVAWDMAIHSVDSEVLIEAQAIRVGGDAAFSGVVPNGFVTVLAPVFEVAGALSIGEGSEYLTEKRGLADDFEDGNIDGWATGGNALWYATSDSVHGGSYSAGSGNIGNSGQSYLSRIVEISGTLTFWWKVSSESNYDYLRFYINGSEQSRISGSTSWQQKTYSVSAGDEIKWNYTKDGSVTHYSDKGWIDNVKLE